MKQVRPGMDLSKVVLPTFILEPRSFLDKISDYYYHADIISKVSQSQCRHWDLIPTSCRRQQRANLS